MKRIAIIPARGGSKRIPKKNIKDFLGKPIIAYSIEVAAQSDLFDEIMVSTDDKEIAGVAKKYGAKVPFLRSAKTSDDFATTYDVIEEVLQRNKNEGKEFGQACCIYPCAPLLEVDTLKKAYELLDENDMVMPVVAFSFPIQRALKKDNSDRVSFFFPEYELSRSQDLELSYHDVGQFYWFDVEKILSSKKLIQPNTGCIVIDEMSAQDIDNLSDWKLAELKYKMKE